VSQLSKRAQDKEIGPELCVCYCQRCGSILYGPPSDYWIRNPLWTVICSRCGLEIEYKEVLLAFQEASRGSKECQNKLIL
jgi:hypothetical protein